MRKRIDRINRINNKKLCAPLGSQSFRCVNFRIGYIIKRFPFALGVLASGIRPSVPTYNSADYIIGFFRHPSVSVIDSEP